ncbi:MAG: RNA polymerase sporulation sigma factor SigK [Lachnospiraceae bacterium]|nr:RNA polymerase sporulation sigma factor SigK [Lachnospiraceae bacterium]
MKTFSKPLTPEEEAYYLKELHSGNEKAMREAKDVLTTRNLRLVAYVLKKYAGTQEDMEDMISCGTIGLIKAVNTYVPGKGTRFATYAAKCIENEILMLLRGHKKIAREVSLYESMGTDKEGNEVNFLDVIEYEQPGALEQLENKESIERLRGVLGKVLSGREREIIAYRYGLKTGDEVTQREVGEIMGISRSYVSRIEKRALHKLRVALEEKAEKQSD